MITISQCRASDSPDADERAEQCLRCKAHELAICSRLPKSDLADLQRVSRRRHLSKGQGLIWEGDESPPIITVIDGMLKLSSSARNGSEQILGLIGPGGFVGRLQGGIARQNVVALTDTDVCIFPTDHFSHLADINPAIRAVLLERSLDELDRTRRWLLLLGRGSAAERVAAMLIDFAGTGPGPHALPLSRGQMAEFAGLTIETVSRQLTRLKSAGIIALPSRDTFQVLDRETLLTMAGVIPEHGLH